MPDTRTHRGPHQSDRRLFAPSMEPVLRHAVTDLSWLLSNGYSRPSALKLVGDRYKLRERQRVAVARSASSEDALRQRFSKQLDLPSPAVKAIVLDGYNVLTTLEVALGQGVVLICSDSTFRDLAGMHGTYRRVVETEQAIEMLDQYMQDQGIEDCLVYLDQPVSNSGRLKQLWKRITSSSSVHWEVELSKDPDAILSATEDIVATADSNVLDKCWRWVNLARAVIEERVKEAWIVNLTQL